MDNLLLWGGGGYTNNKLVQESDISVSPYWVSIPANMFWIEWEHYMQVPNTYVNSITNYSTNPIIIMDDFYGDERDVVRGYRYIDPSSMTYPVQLTSSYTVVAKLGGANIICPDDDYNNVHYPNKICGTLRFQNTGLVIGRANCNITSYSKDLYCDGNTWEIWNDNYKQGIYIQCSENPNL